MEGPRATVITQPASRPSRSSRPSSGPGVSLSLPMRRVRRACCVSLKVMGCNPCSTPIPCSRFCSVETSLRSRSATLPDRNLPCMRTRRCPGQRSWARIATTFALQTSPALALPGSRWRRRLWRACVWHCWMVRGSPSVAAMIHNRSIPLPFRNTLSKPWSRRCTLHGARQIATGT